ncbi:stage II sporulation protein M [Aquibacillus halophilus]|uniref:Stage II sporulation protein M n=1 Tax=Aquibacillus halophilus TaxID=930132 RepID=A0A6A8D9R7_9BACI|nr:stage II sporulation protein M [Aquibacillus halophilus]MRH42328.1 stage II sporulation protein M [Aquibacillus halophilus]
MYKKRTLIAEHFSNHAVIYFFMLVLFLIGVIFGAVIVNSMNFIQKQDLFFYLDRFFGQLLEGPVVDKQEMLRSSLFYHLKYLLLLFILGLSIIGLPIIWILLFVKGLVIGFSVGFFVNQMGWQGLIFAAASIAPQNFLIIPIYLVAGSLAMIFSLTLLRKLFTRRLQQPILQPFLRYTSLYLTLLVIGSLAAIIESFISNEAMQVVIRWIYS